jgi:site-specific DNA-methyltransferase (adenine-specific)
MWYVAPGIAVKKGYTVSIVKSESEGKNLAAYLKSKLCRFIYDATKTSRSLRTPQLKFIPKVALTKKWSDKALYKHFGLTQKEINYIEESIK